MKPFLISIVFTCFINVVFSQEDQIIVKSLEKVKNDFPQEKVFIQTDKSYYFNGETIWMKAWCTLDGTPTYLSRILYIDLVDAAGNVIQKKMFQLDSMSTTGAEFDIASETPSGNYAINAYTLWMLNFPQFIAHKNIYIFGNNSNKKEAKQNNQLFMHFFPEGGNMVAGLKNRIAFKIVDAKGFSQNLKGTITDSKGNIITNFETVHEGMGVIEFETVPNEIYTANIQNTSGAQLQFKLPNSLDEGITLKVENNNPNRFFAIVNRSEKNKSAYNNLKVIAQINHQIVYTADLNIDEGQNTVSISKKKLPAGVLQVTVFNNQNIPLAERLIFIENYEISNTVVAIDTFDLEKRAKNQISFSLPEKKSSVSVAVTSYFDDNNSLEDNIASSLLLTSDLKGYVNNAGYYFKNKSTNTLKHLDLLLMTQGWRRFEWKKILNNNFTEIKYPVESYITVKGKLLKSDRNIAVKDGYIAFLIRGEDSTRIMANATVTDKGEFLLTDINYKKRATISYQGTNKKKENLIVDVKLDPSYIDSLKKSSNTPNYNLDTLDVYNNKTAWADFLKGKALKDTSTKNVKDLGNVTVVTRKKSRIDSLNNEYADGIFAMGTSIDPEEFKTALTVWQMLQQSVPGITVEGNPFDPIVYFNRFKGLDILSNNSSTADIATSSDGSISVNLVLQENGIAFFLNDVNVSKDIISSLTINDIALIKILKNEAAGLGATAGAIAFYTKKGISVSTNIYDKTFTSIERDGYAIVRQFFSPNYSIPEILNNKETDRRFTLYWNANIQTAKDGKYRFVFYNNDVANKFKLLIQGIDKNGQLIFHEQILQ